MFVAAKRANNKDLKKYECLKKNQDFIVEKKQRGALKSSIYRIRLICRGNNLIIWQGSSRSEATKQFDSLSEPNNQQNEQQFESSLEKFWQESIDDDFDDFDATTTAADDFLANTAFADAYDSFGDTLRRTTLELARFSKSDVGLAGVGGEHDVQMLTELCQMSRIILDTIVAFVQRRRSTLSSETVHNVAATHLAGGEHNLIDLMSDVMQVSNETSTNNESLLDFSSPPDLPPKLPPKKSRVKSTNPFDDVDPLASFGGSQPKSVGDVDDFDFLSQMSTKETQHPEQKIDISDNRSQLEQCLDRIKQLRGAQFNVVECLARDCGDAVTTDVKQIVRSSLYYLPLWHPLSRAADNEWAQSLLIDADDEANAVRIRSQLQLWQSAGEHHPVGDACARFARQFSETFAAPKAENIHDMQTMILTFVDALANGIVATFEEFARGFSLRAQVHDAALDVVLASVMALMEQAYRQEYRDADDAFQLKQMELARAKPAMLGVPDALCAAVEKTDFSKTLGVLRGFDRVASVRDMLSCVVRALDSIGADVQASLSAEDDSKLTMTADDLLPVLCFVLLRANDSMRNVVSTVRLLDAFVGESSRQGQLGYALVTLSVATEYLLSLDWTDLEFAITGSSSSNSSPSPPQTNVKKSGRKLSLASMLRRNSSTTTAWTSSNKEEVPELNLCRAPQSSLDGADACLLSTRLCSALVELCRRYERFFAPGGSVAVRVRSAMRADAAFDAFQSGARALDGVAIESLSQNERLLFWLNVYHALLLHAHIVKDDAHSLSKVARVTLHRNMSYRVGGRRFSLLDIEHGVLRARGAAPTTVLLALGGRLLVPKFKRDARSQCIVDETIPQLSFVLSALTKSSPPVRVFASVNTVRADIDRYTSEYLETCVRIDARSETLLLPAQFDWYRKDFPNDIVGWLMKHMKRDSAVYSLLTRKVNDVKTKTQRYDWSEVWSFK